MGRDIRLGSIIDGYRDTRRCAGLLGQAVSPDTLAKLRRKLDWRNFVTPDYRLIALPSNKVDSLAPGSGAQFALLPPENATGNFTKIVQRVPVKILFASDDPVMAQLRPGLSVVATVDTRTKPPDGAETLVPPDARPAGSRSSRRR